MSRINYNKLIPEIKSSRKKPYPVNKYNFKSEKYNYIYNESTNEITYWHGRLEGLISYSSKYGFGLTSWDYYSDSEEECANEVYRKIKQYMKRVIKMNKLHDNARYRKHINWQNWINNYESLRTSQ